MSQQEVIEKQFAVDSAQIAYDNNLITEIVYTDSGLTATVYNNLGYNASPPLPGDNRIVSVQEVANIDFQWGGGSVLNGPYEDVVVKFNGTLTAETTGEYQFYGPADDGFILRINGITIINDWYDKGGGGSFSQPVFLTAGQANTIEAWYYENGGGAWVQLYWTNQGYWQIVPPTAFDTVTTIQTKDPNLLLVLDSAIADLNLAEEEMLINQLNLAQAVEAYNLAVEAQEQSSTSLQAAIQAIPALQQALADAIEATKPQPEPEPKPTPEPTPVPVEPVVPVVPPANPEEPSPEPSQPPLPSPEPSEIPTEQEIPTEPIEEPIEEPSPQPPIEEPVEPIVPESPTEVISALTEVDPSELTEAQIDKLFEAALAVFETAEPGSEEYQEALDALMVVAQADDLELPAELAAIPLLGDIAGAVLEVFNNLGNVGADMSPETRERAEEIIVAAVIVGQVALAATGASVASAVSARRI